MPSLMAGLTFLVAFVHKACDCPRCPVAAGCIRTGYRGLMTASTQPLDLAGDVGELTAALCDIESVSGNEAALAEAITAALLPLPHLQVQRFGNVIVAQTTNPQGLPPVIIAGHLDTVPVAGNLPTWRTDPTPEHPAGRWLHGRGTVDMKAGVAVGLHLAATVGAPRLPITYIWYDNEEVAASKNGLGRLAVEHPELLRGQLAILTEPTDAVVELGCQGTIRVVTTIAGQAAHSARAWRGVNAVHLAGALLALLAAYQPRQVPMGPVTYREGLNAVGVAGGTGLGAAANVLPDRCEVSINYRFAPDRSVEQAVAHVVEQVSHALGGPPARVGNNPENPAVPTDSGSLSPGQWALAVTDASPAAHPGLDQAAVQQCIAALTADLPPEAAAQAVRAKYGWTDVARFAAAGTPALNYAPGDPNLAHRDDERVDLKQIADCAARLRRWLCSC